MNEADENSLVSVESGVNAFQFPSKVPATEVLNQHTTPENLTQKLKLDKKRSLSEFLQTKAGW